MGGKEKFPSRKKFVTKTKPNGDGTDDVWKSDIRYDPKADLTPSKPGSGFVKDDNIPKANTEPYKGRPGKSGGLASFEAAYKKSRDVSGNRADKKITRKKK